MAKYPSFSKLTINTLDTQYVLTSFMGPTYVLATGGKNCKFAGVSSVLKDGKHIKAVQR